MILKTLFTYKISEKIEIIGYNEEKCRRENNIKLGKFTGPHRQSFKRNWQTTGKDGGNKNMQRKLSCYARTQNWKRNTKEIFDGFNEPNN